MQQIAAAMAPINGRGIGQDCVTALRSSLPNAAGLPFSL